MTCLRKQEELAASRAEKKRLGADTHAEVRTILDGHEDILDVFAILNRGVFNERASETYGSCHT